MRVVVDARSLLPVQPGLGPTGVGRWTAGVVQGLAKAAPDWSIELVLVHKEGTIDPKRFGPNVTFRPVRLSTRWERRLRVAGLFPKIDRLIGRPDAVVGPDFVTWKSSGAELPVIHDLTYVRYPRFVSPRSLMYMRSMVPRGVKRARAVITVSEAMRSEISKHYGIDPARIAVVPNGYDPDAVQQAGETELPATVPQEFLLFVGTKEPRKNLLGVLEAYEFASSKAKDRLPPLVVAGGRGWRDATINEALDRAVKGSVITTGYVDDRVLFSLYHHARALIFPTFYEGFGLTVLEAMACGCPVVTSRADAVTEVAGDAALYVDPNDPADIARAIGRMLHDDDLRSSLRERGRERARPFTWSAAGDALKQAILSATAG